MTKWKNCFERTENTLSSILSDSKLAAVGDIYVNLIYSIARSSYNKKGAIHVWDKSLAEALRRAELRNLMSSKLKSGEIADGAEAFIFYSFINEIMSLDEMSNFLIDELKTKDLTERSREKIVAQEAFTKLLIHLKEKIAEEGILIKK
ncbi:MAG: hypothetical protein KAR35_06660 [Candidatus Heimdallarchaeota archaeon]|nr:hypothetical protein [Candidatus Heimdallarchaeota archaeon]MCK5049040.1 hypothetical protein [Candidatus Heimdallarchaeota archaeon]